MKFKAGNYVRVSKVMFLSEKRYEGMVGMVTKEPSVNPGTVAPTTFVATMYQVRLGNGDIVWFFESELELDTGMPSTAQMSFNSFDDVDHDFSSSECTKCGITAYDVTNGSASWMCRARKMPCCEKRGIERWDTTTSQWKCNQCGAVTSNDPNYTSSPSGIWYKPTPVEPKKCECGAEHTRNPLNHSDWCPKYAK